MNEIIIEISEAVKSCIKSSIGIYAKFSKHA